MDWRVFSKKIWTLIWTIQSMLRHKQKYTVSSNSVTPEAGIFISKDSVGGGSYFTFQRGAFTHRHTHTNARTGIDTCRIKPTWVVQKDDTELRYIWGINLKNIIPARKHFCVMRPENLSSAEAGWSLYYYTIPPSAVLGSGRTLQFSPVQILLVLR